ncbi:DUF983 domain-containing protein [Sphingomonas bacterium]|uniref:DUF983 domain-containing protein n=1 Tax=Sphingomonas bacterium TaxID=1895847 RepID=UPI002624E1D6|nr:DUF983 domain-containing protein [Sphingomonas bacterium]MDB5678630.1 hypothetical protein [Sphingomonas bacterium]
MTQERAVAGPTPAEVAFKGLCPRCGAPTLFAGWAKFAGTCSACGLDFSRFNVGDGPAAFLTLILGAIVVGLAIWLELAAHPPWWVHVLLWVPITAAAVLGALRVSKGALLALEYRNRAAEVRNEDAI